MSRCKKEQRNRGFAEALRVVSKSQVVEKRGVVVKKMKRGGECKRNRKCVEVGCTKVQTPWKVRRKRAEERWVFIDQRMNVV